MAGRLEGLTAFVTGAGQGIGRAIAVAFAAEGAQVFAASRTASKLADLRTVSRRITPVALDVTDREAVARIVVDASPLDVLVNCAGWVHNGTLLETTEADWAKSFDQNVTSMFYTIKAALPAMLERRSGSIINIASVASSITGVPSRAAYGASKAAVIGLTKAVARDCVASGVRCNALCPGTTLSPSLEERIQSAPDPEARRREFLARQAMGRLGTPEEMAAAAVYLAGPESAFTTGTVMVVDGGQTL